MKWVDGFYLNSLQFSNERQFIKSLEKKIKTSTFTFYSLFWILIYDLNTVKHKINVEFLTMVLQLLEAMDSQDFEDPFVIIKNVRRWEGNKIIKKISFKKRTMNTFKKKRKFTMESTKTQQLQPDLQYEKINESLVGQISEFELGGNLNIQKDQNYYDHPTTPLPFEHSQFDFDWLKNSPTHVQDNFLYGYQKGPNQVHQVEAFL